MWRTADTGYAVNGGYADYVLAAPNYVGHLPDKLDFGADAPVLCASVTVYKSLKETDTKPGDTVVISGLGGFGHLAVQYAGAMGLHVIGAGISKEKLDLARRASANAIINAIEDDPVAEVAGLWGGADGVLVTAVSRAAFTQGVGMLGKWGTMSLVSFPPVTFDLDIFDKVQSRKTIRGSIVGTRQGSTERLGFAGEGKIKVQYSNGPLKKDARNGGSSSHFLRHSLGRKAARC